MGKKKKKSLSEGLENGDDKVSQDALETDIVKSAEKKSPWPAGQLKDARLIPRIKEFLDARKTKKAPNVFAIVDHLQRRYPEYGRKKRQMFIQYVEKALATLNKYEKLDPEDSSSSEDDDVVLVEYQDSNAMNTMMSNMYRGSPAERDGTSTPDREEKKRKMEPSDSVKKRQRKEGFDAANTNSDSPGVKAGATDKSETFFLDRRGNKNIEKINDSGDDGRERNRNNKNGHSSYTSSKTMTPGGRKTRSLKSEGSAKDSDVESIDQSGLSSVASFAVEEDENSMDVIKLDCSDIQAAVSVKKSRTYFSATPLDVSLQQIEDEAAMEDEATSTPAGKPRKYKGTKKVKGSKTASKQQEGGDSKKAKKDKGPAVQTSSLTFADVGGNEQNLQEICKLLVHMRHPEVYQKLGVTPPRGFLLHGPPGCGKTLLANAIAGELELPLIKLAATEIVSGVSGDSEEKLRDLFEKALQCSPCVMFIDEIDSITPKRETASKDMERRIVAQLLACMDDLNSNPDAQVLVIGATNRPDSMDPALRRAGRFDREICLGIPDEQSRRRILEVLCRDLRLSLDFDFLYLAKSTPGYVGADLMALTREAAMSAVNRVFQELQNIVTPVVMETVVESAMEVDSVNIAPLIDAQLNEALKPGSVVQQAGTGICGSDTTHPSDRTKPTDNSLSDTECDSMMECGGVDSQSKLAEEARTSSTQCQPLVSEQQNCLTKKVEESTGTSIELNNMVSSAEERKTDSRGKDSREKDSCDSKCELRTDSSETSQMGISDGRTTVSEIYKSISESSKPEEINKIDLKITTQNESGSLVSFPAMALSDSAAVEPASVASIGEDGTAGDQEQSSHKTEEVQLKLKSEITAGILSWLKEQPPLTDAQLSDLYITMDDFKEALQHVQPSAKREGFATVPDVTWDDIGALHQVREELQLAILAPVRHAEEFHSLGLNRAQGILLAGPPGCGKTLLAKAVANESGINFISVKGPELLNMYVGESEKAVRTVFQRARNSSPCVIFFDELDALCPRRSGTADSGSSSRVVNQLLTEMDGLEERKQVFIMAATNRPDIIDPAVLRPGRLDKTLYVGLPTKDDRLDIFRCITKNGARPCLGSDVDLVRLAEDGRCDGFTGADLASLVREASVLALKEAIQDKGRQPGATIIVMGEHFEAAFKKIRPSVSAKDQDKYRNMGEKMTSIS